MMSRHLDAVNRRDIDMAKHLESTPVTKPVEAERRAMVEFSLNPLEGDNRKFKRVSYPPCKMPIF